MNNDKLVVCPRCEGNACYGNEVTEEITTWHCFGCGFCTNSLMKEGDEFFDKQKTVLPELYKDLLFVDENGLTWMPSSINKPMKGMVFIDGTTKDNWGWCGVKATKVTEEEKDKFKIPNKEGEYYSHKMDMTTKKNFGKDHMEALDYVGFFDKE